MKQSLLNETGLIDNNLQFCYVQQDIQHGLLCGILLIISTLHKSLSNLLQLVQQQYNSCGCCCPEPAPFLFQQKCGTLSFFKTSSLAHLPRFHVGLRERGNKQEGISGEDLEQRHHYSHKISSPERSQHTQPAQALSVQLERWMYSPCQTCPSPQRNGEPVLKSDSERLCKIKKTFTILTLSHNEQSRNITYP